MIPTSINTDIRKKRSSLNMGTLCHLKHPVVSESSVWDEQWPVSFGGVSRSQGGVQPKKYKDSYV